MEASEVVPKNAFTRAHHSLALEAIKAYDTHQWSPCNKTTLVSFIHPEGLDKFAECGAIFVTTDVGFSGCAMCGCAPKRHRYGLRILLRNQKLPFVRAPMECSRDDLTEGIFVVKGTLTLTAAGAETGITVHQNSEIFIKTNAFTLSSTTGAIFRGHCVHACVDFGANATSSNRSTFLCPNQIDDMIFESPENLTTRSITETHIPYNELLAKQTWMPEILYGPEDVIPWFAEDKKQEKSGDCCTM